MKFIQPVEITAEYKITTPIFLGGADQDSVDAVHFRNASLKGALRFWWRALNWGPTLKACSGNETEALKKLHQREGNLFGRASDGKESLQSPVQLSSELSQCTARPKGAGLGQLAYLLGQGLYHFRAGVTRPYLEGGRLTVTARIKPGTNAEDIASLEQAMIALGIFGALGSRARKGLGSLAIQRLERTDQTAKQYAGVADLEHFINSLDFSAPANAPLTCFSQVTRIDSLTSNQTALSLLESIGQEMQLYRSYGQNGKVGKLEARRNFVDDHDNALKAAQGERINQLPRRSVFGLPHNYFFSSNKAKLDILTKDTHRRSSPLLIHIHEFPNGQCMAIQSLLASRFLPKGTAVELKGKRTNSLTDPAVDYGVIHRYLDGFKQSKVLRHAQ